MIDCLDMGNLGGPRTWLLSTMNWNKVARGVLALIGLGLVTLGAILTAQSQNWITPSLTRKPRGRFFLCKDLVGRTGNHMFQYASLYGIARSKGMVPLIDAQDPINKVFSVWAMKRVRPNKTVSVCDGMHFHQEQRSSAYDEATVTFPENTDIRLSGYFESFMYFRKYEDELRQQFRFPQHVIDKAKQVLSVYLKDLLGENGYGGKSTPTPTLVAVHVRRGDKLTERSIKLGMTVASKDYILKAQDNFTRKYNNVVFVVCSDSMGWCFENLREDRTIFVEGQDAITDLAIMSLCHHSLLTVGTFGWWVAWLVNGETVYYARGIAKNSPLSKHWNMSHHFPPHWIPML